MRQGDPLSPYLFIICAEGLSAIIQEYEHKGLIHGCKVARAAPRISHLFFADDSFFFFKATMSESEKVKECLNLYEKASGQIINFQKSSISFSYNVHSLLKEEICSFFNVTGTIDHGKYLGIPSCVGRNKKEIFSFIKDKAWKRIQGWKRRSLSKAGKEILLKTVIQSVPMYVMQVFLLPIFLCSELERMMNSFWWDKNGLNSRGINWMLWDKLCVHQSKGGLRFKKLHDFNVALLGKQGWKLLTDSESLVGRVFKARYFPKSSMLEAEMGTNPSFIWRSIMAAQNLLKREQDGGSEGVTKYMSFMIHGYRMSRTLMWNLLHHLDWKTLL